MTEEIRWNERKETAGSVITCDKAVLKSFPWKTHMVWFKQRSVEEGTLTRQDPVLSPKTLYRTAAPPSGYETENSTHYLKMASSELSSFIAISLIIKTTYRCHLTVK